MVEAREKYLSVNKCTSLSVNWKGSKWSHFSMTNLFNLHWSDCWQAKVVRDVHHQHIIRIYNNNKLKISTEEICHWLIEYPIRVTGNATQKNTRFLNFQQFLVNSQHGNLSEYAHLSFTQKCLKDWTNAVKISQYSKF